MVLQATEHDRPVHPRSHVQLPGDVHSPWKQVGEHCASAHVAPPQPDEQLHTFGKGPHDAWNVEQGGEHTGTLQSLPDHPGLHVHVLGAVQVPWPATRELHGRLHTGASHRTPDQPASQLHELGATQVPWTQAGEH